MEKTCQEEKRTGKCKIIFAIIPRTRGRPCHHQQGLFNTVRQESRGEALVVVLARLRVERLPLQSPDSNIVLEMNSANNSERIKNVRCRIPFPESPTQDVLRSLFRRGQ